MELRELIARVTHETAQSDMDMCGIYNADDVADAILAALDKAGLVVVPKLPTVDMCEAGLDHMPGNDPTDCMVKAGIVFERMIAASPFAKKEVG